MDAFLEKIADLVAAALLAGIGGVAAYAFDLHDKTCERIVIWDLSIRTFLAVAVGFVAEYLLPPDLFGRGGIIIILGFGSLVILGLFKTLGPGKIKKWLEKWTP